jgi:hypothetical protein
MIKQRTLTVAEAVEFAAGIFNEEPQDFTHIEDDAAVVLATCKEPLYLDGVVALSDKAASALAKHENELALGLTSISDAAAAALARHRGGALCLVKLATLSERAALALSFVPDLYLDGLLSLSEPLAEILADHDGRLSLCGLKILSDQAAKKLSQSRAEIMLYGLREVSLFGASCLAKAERVRVHESQWPEAAAVTFRALRLKTTGNALGTLEWLADS